MTRTTEQQSPATRTGLDGVRRFTESCGLGRPQTRQASSCKGWPPRPDSFKRWLDGALTGARAMPGAAVAAGPERDATASACLTELLPISPDSSPPHPLGSFSRRMGGSDHPFPVQRHCSHVTAQEAGVNAEKVNRYACCVASYSAWNLVGCAPANPGTSGIGKSNDCFRISIALESIGSMKIGLPL